ncbi:hypothetical protein RO3G_06256 [Rhizopus delemar RA 99-880]|uniref:Uncharacterized protein n=1 Tax=Rhizopus delemar (strain RA 99-880 / ATCC MYA-4621 / FGSC 9543 / NRRL 43880) TaxID=246409 RepID=I1BZC1_RHIO9|nr:hypothetical protein RO3G_06256 [Rhizopus delemar RA 99-880]|eukprot:EIE81551.1 hypothetical protein RO3G_06256 [Rhizopus delemar RA 99-880]
MEISLELPCIYELQTNQSKAFHFGGFAGKNHVSSYRAISVPRKIQRLEKNTACRAYSFLSLLGKSKSSTINSTDNNSKYSQTNHASNSSIFPGSENNTTSEVEMEATKVGIGTTYNRTVA